MLLEWFFRDNFRGPVLPWSLIIMFWSLQIPKILFSAFWAVLQKYAIAPKLPENK